VTQVPSGWILVASGDPDGYYFFCLARLLSHSVGDISSYSSNATNMCLFVYSIVRNWPVFQFTRVWTQLKHKAVLRLHNMN